MSIAIFVLLGQQLPVWRFRRLTRILNPFDCLLHLVDLGKTVVARCLNDCLSKFVVFSALQNDIHLDVTFVPNFILRLRCMEFDDREGRQRDNKRN